VIEYEPPGVVLEAETVNVALAAPVPLMVREVGLSTHVKGGVPPPVTPHVNDTVPW